MSIGVQTYRKSADTSRTPSPIIWADCPIELMKRDRGYGHFYETDFIGQTYPALAATEDGLYFAGDTGLTLLALADQDQGVAEIAGNDAANDGCAIMHGLNAGFARFGTNSMDQVWFECCWKKASIATSALSFFIGFAETNVAPTGDITLVDTTGVPDASEDFVGFWCAPTAGSAVQFIYQLGGQTRVQVGSSQTVAADTWYKSGLRYTGKNGGTLEFYHGNLTTGLSLQATLQVTAALNFPDTNHLAGLWAAKTVLTAESKMQMDWIRWGAVGGNI